MGQFEKSQEENKVFVAILNNNGCFSLQDFLITHTILSSFIINHVKFSQ